MGATEPLFALALRELEAKSGSPAIDIKLTGEISAKVRQKKRELGLDPNDTTGGELYHALQALVAKHDAFLAQALGAKDPDDVQDLLPRIIAKVAELPIPKICWAVKHSSAKKLLKALPPKKVMKHLGYKSIDSMLKRENIEELYAALRFAESAAWLERFISSYKKLRPGDFETRPISIIQLPEDRWGALSRHFVYRKRHNITHLKELGVVVVLPMPLQRLHGATITVLPLLIHYINEIRLYSSFFKLQQVKQRFGETLVNVLIADSANVAQLANQPIHWRIIHRYFGMSKREDHPELFEPHVQLEDLEWRSAEAVLYRVEPALKFWENMDYVGALYNGKPVSLSLMDNAVSYCNQLPYERNTIYHFRESLWNEIFIRYVGQKRLEEQIIKQLDASVIEPGFAVGRKVQE